MSPRIQVYTTVACRALHSAQSPGLNVKALQYAALDCSSNAVSARAVKIQACAYILFAILSPLANLTAPTAITTLMNILSAITTGFWSRLGDTHGRKPILVLFLA